MTLGYTTQHKYKSFNGNVMIKIGMQQFKIRKRNSRTTVINNYLIHIQTLISTNVLSCALIGYLSLSITGQTHKYFIIYPNKLTPLFHVSVVMDHEFHHNIVKVAVGPLLLCQCYE